jgi:hypothetical protein
MKINPKFKALILPLAPEELSQLESNLLADGCRDPLVTWKDTLLDGHHRLQICERHNLPFKIKPIELRDEQAAMDWIDSNQLGRRNLTPDQMSLIRGRRYNRMKKPQGGDKKSETVKSKAQIEPLISTAEKLAKAPLPLSAMPSLRKKLRPTQPCSNR